MILIGIYRIVKEEMKTDIEITGEQYYKEQYLRGNLKFLALVTRIIQAKSNFPKHLKQHQMKLNK